MQNQRFRGDFRLIAKHFCPLHRPNLRVSLRVPRPTPENGTRKMKLSAFAITSAKPQDKPFKLSDGDGLHLLVQPSGKKFWRYRYRFVGTEKMLALGSYPATPLADARRRRDEAKKLLEAGTDPSAQKKLERFTVEAAAQNTFGIIASEFLANLKANRAAEATLAKNQWLLENLAAPIAQGPSPKSPRRNCSTS